MGFRWEGGLVCVGGIGLALVFVVSRQTPTPYVGA